VAELTDHVALVTGAGSGIGAATARLMAAQGARVLLADVALAAASAVAESIRSAHPDPHGPRALAVSCDVSRSEQVAAAVAAAVSELGGLHIAIANAGIQLHSQDRDLHQLPESVWDRTHDVNYRGAFLTCKHALAHMVETGHGVIGIVSSVTALAGTTPNVSYATGKAGLLNLARNIAVHYGPRGIRSFAVCPGALEQTPNWNEHPDPDGRLQRTTARIPLGRLGTPEDIAPTIAFAAGPGGRYMNGNVIVVDGGLTVS
jgi:NAD(P)-dependent dehydrogenase (short-subunit alcohol dehydrogenase family)